MSAPDATVIDRALAALPPPVPGRRVVVAMSGGVDSATAAALLVRGGHEVVGMTMRLYDAKGTPAGRGRCCGPRDLDDARRTADALDLPHYVVDLEEAFTAAVVDDFVDTYLDGATPNPCVRCNQYIKFSPLLERARAIGADVLATGHYARLAPDADGVPALRRAADPDKDQSYFLFSMPAAVLSSVWFPLGALTKPDVRAAAAALALPVAHKPESQEICFIPDGDHAAFVARAAVRRGRPLPVAGDIVDAAGTVLGHHGGAHQFTVGQHRGLGNLRAAERMYVTSLSPATGTVTVGPRAATLRAEATIADVRWLAPVPASPASLAVQVRHRGPTVPVTLAHDGPRARITLDTPTVLAPGQAAVLYDGDRVIGGGWLA